MPEVHSVYIDLMGNTETVEVKISQFADDTTIFIADEQSLDIAMAQIDTFCFVAGPSLNMSKSKGFSFGNCNSNLRILIGMMNL